MYTKAKEAPFCSFLYRLTKITILIGFVAFLHDFLPLIQQNIEFQRQTNLLNIVYISLFFIIDVIIIIVFQISRKKKTKLSLSGNKEKEDLECK